jgi:putative lipoic acid-binding regulatory protein
VFYRPGAGAFVQTANFDYNIERPARFEGSAASFHFKIGPAMQPIPTVDSLIEYPSDFPIKVMGATHEDFAATIIDVVLEYDPTFHIGRLEVRPSAKGNYTGLTVMVRATNSTTCTAPCQATTWSRS